MATLQGGPLGPLPDPGALSPAQVEQLRNLKIQTRIANEKYLRTHREVDLLLSGFLRYQIKLKEKGGKIHEAWEAGVSWADPDFKEKKERKGLFQEFPDLLTPKPSMFSREMFLKRPDNIEEFAADYFTDPRLPNKIHMQLIKEKKVAN